MIQTDQAVGRGSGRGAWTLRELGLGTPGPLLCPRPPHPPPLRRLMAGPSPLAELDVSGFEIRPARARPGCAVGPTRHGPDPGHVGPTARVAAFADLVQAHGHGRAFAGGRLGKAVVLALADAAAGAACTAALHRRPVPDDAPVRPMLRFPRLVLGRAYPGPPLRLSTPVTPSDTLQVVVPGLALLPDLERPPRRPSSSSSSRPGPGPQGPTRPPEGYASGGFALTTRALHGPH